MITEDQLEHLCLDWFKSIGYDYICGYDIAPDGDSPERIDYRQIILFDRLNQQLQRINPHIPVDTLETVAQQITKPETPVLIKSNKAFHQFLLEGVKVEYKDEGKSKTDYVQLIDFSNVASNQFLVVNQFTIIGNKGNRRPDVVVFINGIPLAVIELKNPADGNADIWSAYQQLQTYKDDVPDLFTFNEALVVSDGLNARVGSLTSNKERFLPWRTVADEDDKPLFKYRLETLVKGFFKPELFLDYIHYFILFEQDGDALIKKIAGYHQFHAVREAVKATVVASRKGDIEEKRATYADNVETGSGKARIKAIQTMTGTSGRQRADNKALSELSWIDYPTNLLKVYDLVAANYLSKAKTNGDQSKILSVLRNILLPKLLSGEISIDDALSTAEAVA